MPAIMNLPARAGSIVVSDEDAQEVYDLLTQVERGQGVAVDDEPKDTETKARTSARRVAEKVEKLFGVKCRVHVVSGDESEFYGVLSLKPTQGNG